MAYGNTWVVLGIVVTLPFLTRPVRLPVLARLVVKNTTSASRLYLARVMIEALAGVLPDRQIHGVGDAAYSGKDLRGLDDRGSRNVYWPLSAWENLLYFGRLKGLRSTEIKPRARRLLTELGLWERRHEPVGSYSRGMQQKVAVSPR